MSFPTTMWTTIQSAAKRDPAALARFAERYRPVIRQYLAAKGLSDADADEVCQDLFVRVLRGDTLEKADPRRGRFRSLLLTITQRLMIDRHRRRREVELENTDWTADARDPAFDRSWILHLAQQAIEELKSEDSPYYLVLCGHLSGQPQNRHKLWIARRKLIAIIRREIAQTCQSHEEFEAETAYLTTFLRPGNRGTNGQKSDGGSIEN